MTKKSLHRNAFYFQKRDISAPLPAPLAIFQMENHYPDDEDEEGEWAGEEFCFRSNPELRPLEKMILNERRDMLLDASMDGLPELERKYVDYRYGFATGKPMTRSGIAKILDVPEAEAKRIEADALDYLRGCFYVDDVNAFYELRPEAELQKALAQKSQEALFDNFVPVPFSVLLPGGLRKKHLRCQNCAMCLGYLHRCPKFAIQYDDKTKNHGQYLHPGSK